MRKNYLYLFTLTGLILSILVVLPSCTGQAANSNNTMEAPITETSTPQEEEIPQQQEQVEPDSQPEEDEASTPQPDSSNEVSLEDLENSFSLAEAFPNLSFEQPLEFQDPDDGTGRMFIVEQQGRILTVEDSSSQQYQVFLDITDRVNSRGSEQGLLGLAFHPDFEQNGLFFLNYTDSSNTIISRFNVFEDSPDKADPDSELKILTFTQPYANHNGGKIAFGPVDGYLYISTGDGGSAGDPQGNGQSLETLLGKILRIDVNQQQNGQNYSIPPDNPFAGNDQGYLPEIYAYGLRNPWRFSFDAETGTLWAADVGQDKIEEINIIQKGGNYGWNIMEGSQCYNPPIDCNTEGLTMPIYEYEHPLGQSITGGYVYRGSDIPALNGIYVYADFVTGYIWGLDYSSQQAVKNYNLAETGLNISSIGVDKNQQLYFTSFDGKVYQLILP